MKEDGIQMAQQLLDLPLVDGVFSSNDISAINAIQTLKDNGIKIPQDIAFVGFSNEAVSAVIEPSLSTIKQPDFEMGKVAASLLIEQINTKANLRINQTMILEPELIVRDSSRRIK
ncbi:hypothetical protein FFWV33_03285 [Flavobacterium faecale]|uniref:Transcriptional regulator LacI/GalR-like sensor domain-containing protein n=1 Tax=Flavobacterium faecale TaxID=1355330 RepID=A0A2S1LAB6_9FLAO|nr:substrate-binding domain-containing protein [Flavobacterium faecale]AWG20628.1 hypothetical protein FFWV33_03285 [Flavobacterium faecale]